MKNSVLLILLIISCGQPPKEKALSILKDGLNDKSKKVQVAAAGALARLNDPKGYEKLIKCLGDDNQEINALAINKFALIPDTLNGRFLRPFLKGRSPLLKRLAIDALAEIGVVEPTIINMLEERSIPIIVASCNYVGRMKLTKARPKLRRLTRKKEPEVRLAAKIALGMLGDQRASNLIKKEMSEKTPTIWEEAIRGLGMVNDTSSIAFLEDIAEGNIWQLKMAAAEALMRMGKRKNNILISALKSGDPMIRIRAITIIKDLGSEDFLTEIIPLTEDPFLNIALSAIEYISRIKKPEVKKKLIALLNAKNPYVRIAAAEGYLLISGVRS